MQYVSVLVGDASYHGTEALTYSTAHRLASGTLVRVPLREEIVVGVVVGTTHKPNFKVKEVLAVPALPPIPSQLLKTLDWMRAYYPAPLGIIAQLFLPRTLPTDFSLSQTKQAILPKFSLPTLTHDQTEALKHIRQAGFHLLHGETGSGKTRVYIELARQQLQNGRSSLILTPEIGLTSQLVYEFKNAFGDARIALTHSELSEATRTKQWFRMLTTDQPLIVIGPRSAIFSPIKNLGLIVVDESHETAYKQDQAPYYHASKVGAKLAELHGAIFVLGSATPLVSDYFVAQAKKRPIIYMQKLASQSQTTKNLEYSFDVIDLRDKKLFTKSPFIADKLITTAQSKLKAGEQVLFFLNRRGTARMIFCEECGWQALCPHCDLPLVYHGDSHLMRCHTCGYQAKNPVSCPSCGNPSILFTSIGTKALEEEVHRLFPEAKTRRFDTDNKRSERMEAHYEALRSGDINILIGTQTIAKGLDLPRLGLVGVVAADTGLSFPDFSAQERTFQLICQVVGRVGRGHRSTKAIIQTYDPKNPILKAALNKKWDAFYNKELEERRQFTFPPFCYLLKLTCRRASRAAVEQASNDVLKTIRKHKDLAVEGPVPAFHERIKNKYQWQIIVKSKKRQSLVAIIGALPANWSYDIDPLNLL